MDQIRTIHEKSSRRLKRIYEIFGEQVILLFLRIFRVLVLGIRFPERWLRDLSTLRSILLSHGWKNTYFDALPPVYAGPSVDDISRPAYIQYTRSSFSRTRYLNFMSRIMGNLRRVLNLSAGELSRNCNRHTISSFVFTRIVNDNYLVRWF